MMSDEPVDPDSVLQTLIEILNGLADIHARHRSHAPLTPASIRFNESGQVEISSYPASGTQSTVIFGSAKYAVPDALRQGIERQGCAELDAYIVGFIVYELLLGNRLFEGEFKELNKTSASGWLSWHANPAECARPLDKVISGFPPRLSQIVAGLMEKDPEKRTKDLARISEDLQNTIENTLIITNATPTGRVEEAPTASQIGDGPAHRMNRAGQAGLGLCSGGIEYMLRRAARMAAGPRFCLPLAGLVFLALPVWFWKSTARATDVSASLPPVILTDTGEMVLVRVDGAAFAESDELRRPSVSPAFYMDRQEVSSRYYWKFCHATGRSLPASPIWDAGYAERPDNPILNVSLTDAYAFAEWAGKWLPSVHELKMASAAKGHLLDFHVFETAPSGLRTLTWADTTFLDPHSQSRSAVRRDLERNVAVMVPLSDLDGTEAIPFRCAASSEILQTAHFLGKKNPPQSGSPR